MIALDTCVLIWAIRKVAGPGQEDYPERCQKIIDEAQASRQPIMLPSIVVAEFLTGAELSEQGEYRDLLSSGFFIAPFDTRAAWIASELFDRATLNDLKNGGASAPALKADLKIISTCVAHGCDTIYTHNLRDFIPLAKGRMYVRAIPELTAQTAPEAAPMPEDQGTKPDKNQLSLLGEEEDAPGGS